MGIKDLSGFISQGVAGGIIGQYISDIFFNLFVFDKKHFYDVITNVSPTPTYIAATTSGFLNGITSPYIDNISSLALRNVAYVYTNDYFSRKLNEGDIIDDIDVSELVQDTITIVILVWLFSEGRRNNFYNHKLKIAGYEPIYEEDLGFFDEAIKQFDTVTQIRLLKLWIPFVYSNVKSVKTNRGLAYYNKGVAYRQKALYLPLDKQHLVYLYLGKAIEAYTEAIKILKKNYDLYYNRAVAHHLRGEYKEAGLDYCRAIDVSPMNFEGHYNLAVLLRHLNRNRESISELQKAAMLISEPPNSSDVQTAYIFNLLNEVTRRFITSDEYYTEKLNDDPVGSISYTYVNGRVVADDDFDKAMYKNFKTCAGFEFFKEEEK